MEKIEQTLRELSEKVVRLESEVTALKNSKGIDADTLARIVAHLDKYGDPVPPAKPTSPAR